MKKIFIYILLLLCFASSNTEAQVITATHTYDALHRLSSTNYSNGTVISYQYDALGNRTSKTIVGVVCPLPTASFSATSNLLTTTFTNTSTNASSYAWNFGNGQTSTQANPSHTYTSAGTYNVCLIATNACGADTFCSNVTVSNCVSLTSNFTYTVSGNTVTFTNTSTNATSYLWNFGNGQTSVQANPTVTYSTPGTYNVCLTATNACGSVQTCQTVIIICSPLNLNIITSTAPSCVPGCDGNASVTYSANYNYAIAPSGPMISSTGNASGLCAATVYTITATSTSGCTGTTTVQLAAPPPPTVSVASSPANATVCAGASVALTASGASSYNWSPAISNGVSFIPTTTTTYTVTGQDNITNCTSTATKTVVVNPAPTISITSSPSVSSVCNGSSVTLSASGANSYSWSGGITNGTSFVPTSTTIYTVTGVNANGCTKTATKMVIVMNSSTSLTITSNPANATVCAGVPVTLMASGDSMYTWSGGISNYVPFIPLATTTYTVTGTSGNGCTATATKTVTVNPLPVITINASPNDTICQGASIALSASGGASYSWSGGIQQSLPFTPSTSTIYTVTATSAAGCNKTATQSVVVTSPCGSCLPSVIIQGNPFTTALTESGGWIQNSSVVLIPSGANVKLDAHANSFVQLNPGFQTVTGAVFLARPFNGCTAGAPSIAILDTSSSSKSDSTAQHITMRESLVIYPNPTTGLVYIDHPASIEAIELYDMSGKRLQVKSTQGGTHTSLDVSAYATGVYYIRVYGYETIKLIKN